MSYIFTKDILLQWHLCRSRDISIEHTCAYLNPEELQRFSLLAGDIRCASGQSFSRIKLRLGCLEQVFITFFHVRVRVRVDTQPRNRS